MGWQSKKKTRLEPREDVKTRARTGMCRVLVTEEEVRLKVPWGLCVVSKCMETNITIRNKAKYVVDQYWFKMYNGMLWVHSFSWGIK